MDFLTVFGAIIGAILIYSIGAVTGFIFACSRRGRGLSDFTRAVLGSISTMPYPKATKLHLTRRTMR